MHVVAYLVTGRRLCFLDVVCALVELDGVRVAVGVGREGPYAVGAAAVGIDAVLRAGEAVVRVVVAYGRVAGDLLKLAVARGIVRERQHVLGIRARLEPHDLKRVLTRHLVGTSLDLVRRGIRVIRCPRVAVTKHVVAHVIAQRCRTAGDGVIERRRIRVGHEDMGQHDISVGSHRRAVVPCARPQRRVEARSAVTEPHLPSKLFIAIVA